MGNKVKGTKRQAEQQPAQKKQKTKEVKVEKVTTKTVKVAKKVESDEESEDIELSDSEDEKSEEEENESEEEEEESESEKEENESEEEENEDEESDDLDDESDDLDKSDDDSDKKENDKEDKENDKENGKENDSKSNRAEQKKVLAERKLSRKAGAEVQQIKALWEKLRVNKPTPPKQVREKLCNQVWELSKDVILDLVLKHDASRVVQTLVKYSSKERRLIIAKALVGHYYALATSSYGKYLLIKLLHYGTKESRALIVNELFGKLRKLMRHKEGAYVVEDLFVLYSTAEQRRQMIREFWGSEYAVFKESGEGKTVVDVIAESAEKKSLVASNLYGTISAAVEKGSTGFELLHAVMREYVSVLTSDVTAFDKQIREFIELLVEQFAELVHTNDGSHVACSLIALANAKERKNIIRHLKTHTGELGRNEYGHLVLITLFRTVDDSVLLHKSFCVEMFTDENTPALIQDKFYRRPLLYILKGLDGRYFNPQVRAQIEAYDKLAYACFTKKPQETRRNELLSRALPVVYQNIISVGSDLKDLVYINMAAQFIAELCLTPGEDDLRKSLVDMLFECTVKGDVREDYHLINKVPFVARLLKALIHGTEYRFDNDKKALVKTENEPLPHVGTEFAKRVEEVILENPSAWSGGQPAFVAVAVVEVVGAKRLKKGYKGVDLGGDKGGELLKRTIK